MTTELDLEGDADGTVAMLREFATELRALELSGRDGFPDSFIVEGGLLTLDMGPSGKARVHIDVTGETRVWQIVLPYAPDAALEPARARSLDYVRGVIGTAADLIDLASGSHEPDGSDVDEDDSTGLDLVATKLRRLAMKERLSLIGAIAAGACGHGGIERLIAIAPSPWRDFALQTTDGVDLPLDARTVAFANAAIPVCAHLTGTTIQGRRIRAVDFEAAATPMGTAETMRLLADGPEALAARIASGWNPAA